MSAVDHHAYHDPDCQRYTDEQRDLLKQVQAFNRQLVAAGEAGLDLSEVLDRLDPDPARYLWVDEGGGHLGELIERARTLLRVSPPLPGHVCYSTAPIAAQSASRPTVATGLDGRLLVAWISWQPGAGDQIVAMMMDPDGVAPPQSEPISATMADCFRPRAVFDVTGRAWLFYPRSGPGVGGEVAVYARCHEGPRLGIRAAGQHHGSPSFNQEVVAQYADANPEMVDLFEGIGEPITEEIMIDLNERVDVDGEFPEDVAEQYLAEQGFTG